MKTNRIYNVFVQGDFANKSSGDVMASHPSRRFQVVKNILYSDVVVFTGGADINPSIYDSRPLPSTHFWPQRDQQDLRAIEQSQGKALVGICRGAQLLNCVPNGGSLWQDVDRHAGASHIVEDFVNQTKWSTNSLHHQMMRPGPNAEIVAGCRLASFKETYEERWNRSQAIEGEEYDIDPEVIWYEKTRSLLVQFHPEFGDRSTTEYFHDLVDRYLLPSLDRKWQAMADNMNRVDVI